MSESTTTPASGKTKEEAVAAVKTWHYELRPSVQDAVDYVNNVPPPQGAGEAVFQVRDDGAVHLFIYW
jgi:hypothetical protein